MFDDSFVVATPDRRLTARDYKTLSLATLGGLLEFYDFIIFVFFANTIGQLFFPPGLGAAIGIWAPVLLLLLRILQGVAVGGEVPGAWAFVSEHVDPSHVGIACGILTAGLTELGPVAHAGRSSGNLKLKSRTSPQAILTRQWR